MKERTCCFTGHREIEAEDALTIEKNLKHLGVDGIWFSPLYASPNADMEIGRASCRERVCLSV